MSQEIEIKLSLSPDLVKPCREQLKGLLGVSSVPRAQRLRTIYFDTDDRWLQRHGMALRIRCIGRRRVQTLKAPGRRLDGLQSFNEYENEVQGDIPHIEAVADEKIRRKLVAANVMARLRPLFTTRFDRLTLPFRRAESEIELALDSGFIEVETGRIPIAEIELELKSGNAVDVLNCAEWLADEMPVRLGLSTKAERGYALAFDQVPGPVRATPVELPPDCQTGDAFAAIVRNCISQLRANEPAIDRSDDPEAIHQFRVAIRRFRAAIAVYRELIDDAAHAAMAIDLRWLQRQFGPARDLDVLISDTLVPMQESMPDLALLGDIVEIAKKARAEARRRSHFALENPRYAVMLIQIYRLLLTEGWRGSMPDVRMRLQAPARDFADALLAKAHRRLVRHGGEDARLSETDLHRLRLLAKKMRYVSQAFAPFYRGRKVERYLTHLGEVQDQLGSLNDAVVSRRLLSDLAAGTGRIRTLDAAEVRHLEGVMLGWQSCRISRDLHGFRNTWKAFREQRKFWTGD